MDFVMYLCDEVFFLLLTFIRHGLGAPEWPAAEGGGWLQQPLVLGCQQR
jgi:hypothetical protein